jgi:hypothetical protein
MEWHYPNEDKIMEDPTRPTLSIEDIASPISDPGMIDQLVNGGGDPSQGPSIEDIAISTEPTGEEKMREIGYGTQIGVIQGGTTMGTALAGARTAAALTPPVLPVVGPFAKPIAGAVGFGLGLTAGMLATQNVYQLYPDVPREELTPYREGGKTFGESIGAAPVAFGIPVMNANRVARFMSGIGEAARKYPKSYLVSELMGGVGAGVAGGASESYFPGQAGPRFGAEVVGGFFSPGRFLVSATGAVKDFTKTMMSSMSPSSREARAANSLYTLLDNTGTDIPALIRALETASPAGVKVSAAQKTGEPALQMLETTLARGNSKYGAEVSKMGDDSIIAYEKLVAKLRDIGTPAALTKAAELESIRFEALLDGRMALADADAAFKISKISKDTPSARAEIGQIVRSETERALGDARIQEKALWLDAFKGSFRNKIVKGQKTIALQTVEPTNTGTSFLDIATSMTPERFKYRMPAEVKSIMSRMGITDDAITRYAAGKQTKEFLETGIVPAEYLTVQQGKKVASVFKKTDVQDLINIRSDLLAFARDASSKGDISNAGFYGRMAESVLDDLSAMKNPAYDKARQFSRTLNDYFTRSYAGDLVAVNKKGAEKLPPELIVAKAFGSGTDVTAHRMSDIEDAVGMMGAQYDDAVAKFGKKSAQAQALEGAANLSKQRVVSIRDAQGRALRLAAAKSIDPITGRVNPKTLATFVAENKPMLDRLQITSDLSDAVKAENAFRAMEQTNSVARKTMAQQAAFAQVLKFENPTSAITDALNGRYPVKSFSNIVTLAKSGGQDALEGLKASIYDYAFIKAGGEAGFSPAAFDKALFSPIAPGQPSLFNILRSQNAITMTEAKNLRKLTVPMLKIEKAMKNNQLTDDVIKGADAVTELALRITGAKLGTALTPGGNSLVASSAGSKFIRKQFDKIPTFMVRGIIEKATQDPQLMALLLKRGVTQQEKFKISRQLHAYGIAAGLNFAEQDDEPMPPAEKPRPSLQYIDQPSSSRRSLDSLPTAQTRGTKPKTPAAPAPAAPAPGPVSMATPQGPAEQSSSRKMLQSLFPMDSISSMA